jgi:hypothetical protein
VHTAVEMPESRDDDWQEQQIGDVTTASVSSDRTLIRDQGIPLQVVRRSEGRLRRNKAGLETTPAPGFAPHANRPSEGDRDALDHGQAQPDAGDASAAGLCRAIERLVKGDVRMPGQDRQFG